MKKRRKTGIKKIPSMIENYKEAIDKKEIPGYFIEFHAAFDRSCLQRKDLYKKCISFTL